MENKLIVVIINGKPRAGKDTLVAYTRHHLRIAGVGTASHSSIEPVKNMMHNAGVFIGKKDEADRALLSEVGDSLEKHSFFKTKLCLDKIHALDDRTVGDGAVMFLDVREKLMMDKLEAELQSFEDIWFHKILLVSNRQAEITSNTADANVGQAVYHETLTNNGTMADFDNTAQALAGRLQKMIKGNT